MIIKLNNNIKEGVHYSIMTLNELIQSCIEINNNLHLSENEKTDKINNLVITEDEAKYSKRKVDKLIKRLKTYGINTVALELWNEVRV